MFIAVAPYCKNGLRLCLILSICLRHRPGASPPHCLKNNAGGLTSTVFCAILKINHLPVSAITPEADRQQPKRPAASAAGAIPTEA